MASAKQSERALKQALKEALTETLHEQRELLQEVFSEALVDFALTAAIREGQATKKVRHPAWARAGTAFSMPVP